MTKTARTIAAVERALDEFGNPARWLPQMARAMFAGMSDAERECFDDVEDFIDACTIRDIQIHQET